VYFTQPVAVKPRIAAAGMSTRDTRSFARIRRLIKGLVPDSLWEQEASTPIALVTQGRGKVALGGHPAPQHRLSNRAGRSDDALSAVILQALRPQPTVGKLLIAALRNDPRITKQSTKQEENTDAEDR
jgi:hypothetical protein